MKKGFTLIELLGVILLLGVIATIATPVVLNITSSTKEIAAEESIKMYIKAVNNKIAASRIKHKKIEDGTYEITDNGNKICLVSGCSDYIEIDYSGNKIESGYINIKNGKVYSFEYLKIGNIAYSGDMNNLTSIETSTSIVKTPDECFILDPNDSSVISGYDVDNSKCTKNVTIPNKINGVEIKTIGDESFLGKELENVTILNGIKKIGNIAFSDNKLTSLTMPDSIEEIGDYAFESNLISNLKLSRNLKIISQYSFANNALTNLVLPDSILTIEEGSFSDSKIENLKIGSGVKTIGKSAFIGNPLTRLTIPGNVESIGEGAFAYNSIINLKLENGIKIIGELAFRGNQITSLIIPPSLEEMGDSAFIENAVETLDLSNATQLKTIGPYAFNNNKIKNIQFSNTLEEIGEYAFSENYLSNIIIPDSVKTIGEYAFSTNNLKTVKIGNEITYIGESAFESTIYNLDGYGPNQIESIIINSNSSSVSYENAFKGFNGTICFLKDNPNCGN